MRTRIAYYTTDEVNHTLVQRMVRQYGAPLIRTSPGLATSGGSPAASLHDLDHLWPPQRTAILESLLAGRPSNTVAVHGYCLTEDQVQSLRGNGVIVSRSLDSNLFDRLCNASEPDREPLPLDGDRDVDENPTDDSPNPAALCMLVRSLANQAHKTLKHPARSSDHERRELRRQLANLQTHLDRHRRSHALRLEELQRWLDSLVKRVEHHVS
jgi:hypothetical protein